MNLIYGKGFILVLCIYPCGLLSWTSPTAQGVTEEPDYVEFSAMEAMVASGGDSRLQALRKHLQSKKELLKQLDRMYSSYLGGTAAASECSVTECSILCENAFNFTSLYSITCSLPSSMLCSIRPFASIFPL